MTEHALLGFDAQPQLQHRPLTRQRPASSTASMPLQDPEDMVLLREKLTQIAVGRREQDGDAYAQAGAYARGDDEERDASFCPSALGIAAHPAQMHAQRPHLHGHFRVFLPVADHPSTPPSSPQPRDVLRRHLLRKKTARKTHRMMSDDADDDDEPFDGMCIDGMEISPLPLPVPQDVDMRPPPSSTSVRLSVPEDLRIMSSSFSVLSKCPEGYRKRKAMSVEGRSEALVDANIAPLKKTSSQVNILTSESACLIWDPCAAYPDHEMEDASTSKRLDRRSACS